MKYVVYVPVPLYVQVNPNSCCNVECSPEPYIKDQMTKLRSFFEPEDRILYVATHDPELRVTALRA